MDNTDETLRIELPWFIRTPTPKAFIAIERSDASQIKSLIIQQDKYDRYEAYYSNDHLVIIPETICRLVAVETLTISACITELPVAISKLNNLKLLDLSGCYNLFSIPEEILKMKDLKIKIGDIISRASEVVFINVPLTGITPEVFSKINSANKKIEQLILYQRRSRGPYESQEEFEVPDGIKDLTDLKILSLTGKFTSLPSWIGNLSALCSLTVSASDLESLPESIGNLSNLTSLDLSEWSHLKSFPSSLQNLPHLTNVKMTHCYFWHFPSGIEYLKEVTNLDLSRCNNFYPLPESIGSLSKHSI